jgi:hypothetical protein
MQVEIHRIFFSIIGVDTLFFVISRSRLYTGPTSSVGNCVETANNAIQQHYAPATVENSDYTNNPMVSVIAISSNYA